MMDNKHDSKAYEAPQVYSLGTVEQMTERLNKVGSATDKFTALTGLIAWFAHRGYHGLAMPTWERKFRVIGDWVQNFVHGREVVSLETVQQPRAAFEEFAARISLNTEYAYTPRKLRVITIGAGFSGLLIAHKFEHRFPELKDLVDHTILEARSDVGGTW